MPNLCYCLALLPNLLPRDILPGHIYCPPCKQVVYWQRSNAFCNTSTLLVAVCILFYFIWGAWFRPSLAVLTATFGSVCAQGSLPAVLRGPYVVRNQTACKANGLPRLSLRPLCAHYKTIVLCITPLCMKPCLRLWWKQLGNDKFIFGQCFLGILKLYVKLNLIFTYPWY